MAREQEGRKGKAKVKAPESKIAFLSFNLIGASP